MRYRIPVKKISSAVIKKLEEAPLDYCKELFGCSIEDIKEEVSESYFGEEVVNNDIKNLIKKSKICFLQKEK